MSVYSCCHDLMQKAMNSSGAATVSVIGSDCRIHLWYMSKDDALNLMKNSDLSKKLDSYNFFLV